MEKQYIREKITKEEIEKNMSRFSIKIVDNERNEVIIDATTDAIIGVTAIHNIEKPSETELRSLCLTSCPTETLIGCLKGLDKIQKTIMLEMTKGVLEDMLKTDGGNNE